MRAIWRDVMGVLLVGDGVLATWIPQRHAARWLGGPKWWVSMMRPFVANPGLTRAVGLLEVGFGMWIARKAVGK